MYAETLFLPHTDVKSNTRCVPKQGNIIRK